MSKAATFVRYYLPALAWASLIFFFSSLPSNSVPRIATNFDDLFLHFVVYAILGFLLGQAFLHSPEKNRLTWFVVACLIGILYGASDEFHQMFVPGRHATISDLIADALGVLTGTILYSWLRKKQPRFLCLM